MSAASVQRDMAARAAGAGERLPLTRPVYPFRKGVALGLTLTLLFGASVVYLAVLLGGDPLLPGGVREAVRWVERNLGYSVPVFAALAGLFAVSLNTLERRVAPVLPDVDAVAQADHLSDLWASLFFGTGVIWTAIGMRGALLYALGDPANLGADGAFEVLQRMVDGGILLALSTTIVGGVGGYLLRTWKTVCVGRDLKRVYALEARTSAANIRASLERIEEGLVPRDSP